MKWWQWLLVAMLVVSCAVGVTLGVVLSQKPGPSPTPIPSTTIQPFPSLTITPRYGELTLLHDTFQGPAHLPLTQHAPNAPIGIFWVPYVLLPEVPMELTGAGAASNLTNTSSSPAVLVYAGANITSGKFSNLGYHPATDILTMRVTLTLPTIDPRPNGNETVLVFFGLSRTLPQNDMLAMGLEYRLGKATSDPPSWSFGASTNYDSNGVNAKTQTIVDTGFVSGDPPLNTPLHLSFSVHPDGRCVVACPELNVSAEGPSQPDIVPQEGFAMNSFSMVVIATQESITSAQPLQVHITEVKVVSEYQITGSSRQAAVVPLLATEVAPVSAVWPLAFQQRMAALGLPWKNEGNIAIVG